MFQYGPNCYLKLVPNSFCKRKINKKKVVSTKRILYTKVRCLYKCREWLSRVRPGFYSVYTSR